MLYIIQSYRANASTTLATKYAGMLKSFGPYFSYLIAIFNAVKGKARAPNMRVILIHHIVLSSMVVIYMKKSPLNCTDLFGPRFVLLKRKIDFVFILN